MTGRAAACWELPDVRRGGRLSGRSRRFSAGCHGFSILEKRALTQIQNTLADSRFAGVGSTFSSRILDLQVRGVHFHCGFSICRCGEYVFIADSRFAGARSPFSRTRFGFSAGRALARIRAATSTVIGKVEFRLRLIQHHLGPISLDGHF